MEQKLFSNINGVLIPTIETDISSANELVRSRYGLYETMLLRDGIIELSDLHWERLWTGMKVLGFEIPKAFKAGFFEEQILSLAIKNKANHLGRIRIQVYAKNDEQPYEALYFVEAIPIERALTQWNEKGLVLGFLEDFKKPMKLESNSKISHSLHIPLAKTTIAEHNWDDALLMNTEDRVIESSMANLFWIKEDMFYTPPLSEGCLAGTMRHWIIDQLRSNGFQLVEKALSISVLLEAEEVFLTNGIRKIKWVEQIGEQQFGNQKAHEFYFKILK